MFHSPRAAARAAFLALALAGAAVTPPLAAQQAASGDPAPTVQAAPASEAPNAAAAPAAGPRLNTSMARVEGRFNTPASVLRQDNVDVNHSYLVYILVVAVLVVLLIFLIKRA